MFKDQWQIKTCLPNGDELSTVKLPEQFYKDQWESCWFYAEGGSDVVERYDNVEDAVKGHCVQVAHALMESVAKIQQEDQQLGLDV
jgi:hypothetical protein